LSLLEPISSSLGSFLALLSCPSCHMIAPIHQSIL
jgi:hypothetical protein